MQTIDNIGIPEIAKWKALLTEHGVDFADPQLFVDYPDISSFKTKARAMRPVTERLRVFDRSEDKSIIPSEITIQRGDRSSIVKLGYRPGSPIEIGVKGGTRLFLRDRESQEEIPVGVEMVRKLKYQGANVPKELNSLQPKLSDFVDVVGLDRLSVLPFDGCWLWNVGKACEFCDLHPKQEGVVSGKPSLNELRDFNADIDIWWSTNRERYLGSLRYAFDYLLKTEELKPHRHLLIMSGNLARSVKVWDIALDTIQALNTVESMANFDSYLNVSPHPDVAHLQQARNLGIKQVQYNLEVIGAERFKQICPGKLNYPAFMGKLEEAVGVMGFGNVRSNLVLGLQPPEELMAGVEDLARNGIVADFSVFQPKRGTPLEQRPSPDFKTIIDFTKGLSAVYQRYGFKPIYCEMSSRSSIINECMNGK